MYWDLILYIIRDSTKTFGRKGMNRRRLLRITVFFICIGLTLTAGCNTKTTQKYEKVEKTDYMMGTVVTLKVYTTDTQKGNRVIDRAFERIKEIEQLMSTSIRTSDVSRINEAAGIGWVEINQDTLGVIQRGLYYGSLSQGLFDITVGPLVRLWGIGTDHPRVPSAGELEKAIGFVDYRGVRIDEKSRKVMLDREGMMLDLGGIAKGYAADQVKEVMLAEGIKHAVINLGGNVLTLGNRYDGRNWNIGIQDPYAPTGSPMGLIRVKDKTVVTSGDYERYFEKDGRRYHHILNPGTGYPEINQLKSVTIIADKSFDADALSTTVFLMGREKGMELVERLEGIEAIMIAKDKKVIVSSGIGDSFTITNDNYKME